MNGLAYGSNEIIKKAVKLSLSRENGIILLQKTNYAMLEAYRQCVTTGLSIKNYTALCRLVSRAHGKLGQKHTQLKSFYTLKRKERKENPRVKEINIRALFTFTIQYLYY